MTTDRALADRVPWCDLTPTAAECALPAQAWDAMVAGRVATLLSAYPQAPVVLLEDEPAGPALEDVLAAREDVRRGGPAAADGPEVS